MKNILKHPFEPIIDSNTEILILGSFPSIVSREKHFYYMHPTNRFYPMLSDVFHDDFVNATIEEKILLLKKHHIGLYDSISSGYIPSSSDSDIKNIKPLDVESFLRQYPNVKYVICNGKTSYTTIIKNNKDNKKVFYLSSTSAANAKVKLEDLVNQFKSIINS